MTCFVVTLLRKGEISGLKKTGELETDTFALVFKFKFFVLY